MCMLQRFQILITEEQRRRLELEARRRHESVASLIREAIDAHFGPTTLEGRLEALEAIREMKGTFLSPDELDRITEEEREHVVGDLGLP